MEGRGEWEVVTIRQRGKRSDSELRNYGINAWKCRNNRIGGNIARNGEMCILTCYGVCCCKEWKTKRTNKMSCLLLLMIASQFFLLSTFLFFCFCCRYWYRFLKFAFKCLWSPYFFSLSYFYFIYIFFIFGIFLISDKIKIFI